VLHRILLIEDNELNRDMLSRRLARAGFEVLTAPTASRGLEMAHAQHPNLVLIDLRLPDLSGVELARILRDDSHTSHIPLIALTADAMPGDREKALAAGCDDYDTKPIELPRLLDKIRVQITSATLRGQSSADNTLPPDQHNV
jgi:CheY-like chemotaxis protein